MMELKGHVKLVLRLNPMIFIARQPTSEFDPEFEECLFHKTLGTKEMGNDPCFHHSCDNVNHDYCWNCERPICIEHCYRVVFALTGIMFNVCKECANSIENSDILRNVDDLFDREMKY